jgi:hypothetical protein
MLETTAGAAPPPPPPSYVTAVATLLTDKGNASAVNRLSNFVADDVRVYVNDRLVADGKPNWMRHITAIPPRAGEPLAYSEGWKDGGSLMIVDQYDTIDRSNQPPDFLSDPRYATRTTLYQFAADGKIHVIRAVTADGFWVKP